MTYLEDGLRVPNGLAERPLAEAALDRAARAIAPLIRRGVRVEWLVADRLVCA
ncbi:hypothetical protein [Streptomyces sp. NPDC086989]|uniref:hypothetical protein n=1 Tax=Streptomyces sp. NPDC086989 TaxID=3365764 RepID=UPI0037FAF374